MAGVITLVYARSSFGTIGLFFLKSIKKVAYSTLCSIKVAYLALFRSITDSWAKIKKAYVWQKTNRVDIKPRHWGQQ